MARNFRRSIRAGNRRKWQWLGSVAASEPAAFALSTVAFTSVGESIWLRAPAGSVDSFNDEPVEVDWTLMREINCGKFTVRSTSSGNVGYVVGMGVIVWDAIDDGIIPIFDAPLPVQSPQFDWLWWWSSPASARPMGVGDYDNGDSLFGPDGNTFQKTQRKLSQGSGLLLVVECMSTIDGNAATFSWAHSARYGYKIP